MHPGAAQWTEQLAGRFERHAEVLGQLGTVGEDGAWAAALRVSASLAGVEPTGAVSVRDLAAFADGSPGARAAAAHAVVDLARAALMDFDGAALRGAEAMHRALMGADASPAAQAWAEALALMCEITASGGRGLGVRCMALGKTAGQSGSAPLVILATTLHALALLREDDLATATSIARRASRMARTEALPQYEYLANVVLARVRRLSGRPHLAVRILSGLARIAPPRWHGWLAWELLLSGESALATELLTGAGARRGAPCVAAGTALRNMLEAYASGTPEDAVKSRAELMALDAPWPVSSEEVAMIHASLDASVDTGAVRSKRFARWCAGAKEELPSELSGLATRARDDSGDAIAAVVVDGRGAARRILSLGVTAAVQRGALRIPTGARGKDRIHHVIAALAFAGAPGLAAEALYREVYGVTFDEKVDARTLDVMVHRVRKELPAGVTLSRARKGNLALEVTQAFVVPDPRCQESAHDRMLRLIAKTPGISSEGAAEALGIALRTAQEILRDLAEDGACVLSKDTGLARYDVVDTTFCEPTRF